MLRLRYYAIIVSVFLACVSCTVKEDRIDCPSYLVLDFSELKHEPEIEVYIYNESDSLTTVRRAGEDRIIVPVRKGTNRIFYASGRHNDYVLDAREHKNIFAGYDIVDCLGEYSYDTLRLHKQFCKLTIETISPPEEKYPFTLSIKGNVVGYDIRKAAPVAGFHFPEGLENKGNLFTYDIPRQDGYDMLTLYIIDGGQTIKEFDLATLLREKGYDWKKKDLDDIKVTIDYSRIGTAIEIGKWTGGITINTEI